MSDKEFRRRVIVGHIVGLVAGAATGVAAIVASVPGAFIALAVLGSGRLAVDFYTSWLDYRQIRRDRRLLAGGKP